MTTRSVWLTGRLRASPWLASKPWPSRGSIPPFFLMEPSQSTTSSTCFIINTLPLPRFHSTNPDRQSSDSSSSSDSASTNVFMDLIAAMRWKAANALTSSLSNEERSLLLQRLDKHKHTEKPNTTKDKDVTDKQSENNEDNVQHTIAEAVAAARAQEAQRSQQKWQKEKEVLLVEAERAARARVDADLAIQRRRVQFEQWKAQVEHAKNTTESVASATSSSTNATIGPEEIQQQQQDQDSSPGIEDTSAHPVLGPCVLDLGYKRIHVVDAQALTAIPVWKKQRIYRHDRAKKMADDKLKTLDLGLPGVLCVHENKEGKLSILDGQHRIGMLETLSKNKTATALLEKKVLVEVYPQLDHHGANHAQYLFLEINKAEPIKLVDLIAKKGDRDLLTAATDALAEQYDKMFSSSQRCRAPHLNVDNLRDALFAANVIARHNIKTAPQLLAWMMEQNERLKQIYTDPEDPARELVTQTALKKALEHDFYLGIESSWYYK